MHRFDVKNKVVAITGGASGIGLALGCAFARSGAIVGLLDRDGAGAQAAARALRKTGLRARGFPCDVTREAQCRAVAQTLVADFGGLDVWVNNAGITLRDSFRRTRAEAYRKVMEVNFFGAVNGTRAAVEHLIARRGMIIVTSSIAGFAPLPGRTGYSASKYALHGFFETLRVELKPVGVHVLIACPSFVETNLQTRALGGDGRVTRRPQSTMGKPQSAEQVAAAIFRAAVKKKDLVVPSVTGKLAFWVSRLLPRSYARIVARQFKDELER